MSNEIELHLRMAIFKGKQIRKVIHNDEWYFSITDIIDVLTDSANSRRYWSDLKRKLIENEGFAQLYEKIVQLKAVNLSCPGFLDSSSTFTSLHIL
jgi:prophage antirepressor-like protein